MLIEEFWCTVDMVVGAGVGSSYNHHCQAGSTGRRRVIDAIIVDRGFQ
jgi:hypothetical protein